jgi:hypothetical protein
MTQPQNRRLVTEDDLAELVLSGGRGSRILTGEGPPAEDLDAAEGDTYIDTLNGNLYTLNA